MSKTVNRGSDRTGSEYRDSHGKRLDEYPRPSVAVDTALLTLVAGEGGLQLSVLEVRRVGGVGWGLPGTFLHPGERLIDAVQRSLREKAGVSGFSPRQLQVFDDPERDDRGWVLSVAHVDVVAAERLSGLGADTRLTSIDAPGRLPYGHEKIIALAVSELRGRYSAGPDPSSLLPSTFTLRELRLVHEAVAGVGLQRDTFRRAMEPQLIATGEMSTGSVGRPAELFSVARSDQT